MTVILHKFNAELSREVYEHCKKVLEMKMCYNNVFNIVSDFHYSHNFRDGGEWKIAYGYYSIFDRFYARHCFIVNNKNEVIDATVFTQSENVQKERDYFSFKVFNNYDEYEKALWENDREPALYRVLRKEEAKTFVWANKNGITLIG